MKEKRLFCKNCKYFGWRDKALYFCIFADKRNSYGTVYGEPTSKYNDNFNCIYYNKKFWKFWI